MKRTRKRKLQGTYFDLSNISSPGYENCLHEISTEKVCKDRWPSESSGVYTASELSQCTSPLDKITSAADDTSASDLSTTTNVTPVTSITNVRHSMAFVGHGLETSASFAFGGVPRDPGANPETTPDWRRGGRRSRTRLAGSSRDDGPAMPGAPIDIWSFGCLLFEAVTGSKLFRTGDKLASVLKPRQLLEMRIGETEIKYCEKSEGDLFAQIKDLVFQCLADNPEDRPSAEKALEHPFCSMALKPSVKDLALLPSTVLRITDILRDKENANEEDVKGKEEEPVSSPEMKICSSKNSLLVMSMMTLSLFQPYSAISVARPRDLVL